MRIDRRIWVVATGALLICGSAALVAVASPAEKTVILGKPVTAPPRTIGKPVTAPPRIGLGGNGVDDCKPVYEASEDCLEHAVVNVTGSCKSPLVCRLYEHTRTGVVIVTPGHTCRNFPNTFTAACAP